MRHFPRIQIGNKLKLSHWCSVLILILIGTFLRFFLLTNQSLWWDEGFSLQNSSGVSVGENLRIVRNIHHADKFQPFYYWILFFARQAFGDSEQVLRGLSAIIGVLTLPIIYFIALRFYNKRHALWSLALATFSSFLIYYSQEVRNYSLLIFISAAQLYCLSEVILYSEKPRTYYKWGHGVLTGIGLLCSIQMAVFSAGLSVAHLIINRRWKEWLNWWLPAAVCTLPAFLYYFTLPGTVSPDTVSVSRATTPLIFNLFFVAYGILVGTTYGPSQDSLRGNDKLAAIINYAPELLLLGFISLGILFFLWRILGNSHRDSKFHQANLFFTYLFFSSSFFGILLALVTGMNLVPRHAFYLWVQVPILLPSVFCWPKSVLNRTTTEFQNLSILLIVALIGLNIYSTFNYYFKSIYWRDDYRSVAEYLINSQNSSNTILLSGEPFILSYYGDARTGYVGGKWMGKALGGNPEWIDGFNQVAGDSETITVAIYRPKRYTKTDFESDFSEDYNILAKVDKFNGFEILHLETK